MYALRHCDPKARLHSFSSGTMTVPGACSRLRAGANNTCLRKCGVTWLPESSSAGHVRRKSESGASVAASPSRVHPLHATPRCRQRHSQAWRKVQPTPEGLRPGNRATMKCMLVVSTALVATTRASWMLNAGLLLLHEVSTLSPSMVLFLPSRSDESVVSPSCPMFFQVLA